MNSRIARSEDIPRIDALAREQSVVIQEISEGVAAIYRVDVLKSIVQEERSLVLVDNNDQIQGYFLACSTTTEVFGMTLEIMLREYNISILPDTCYGAQVCLSRAAQQNAHYSKFHDRVLTELRHSGMKNIYAEVLSTNTRSMKVHEHLGWEHVGSRSAASLQSFKGVIDYAELQNAGSTADPYDLPIYCRPVQWNLLHRRLT